MLKYGTKNAKYGVQLFVILPSTYMAATYSLPMLPEV